MDSFSATFDTLKQQIIKFDLIGQSNRFLTLYSKKCISWIDFYMEIYEKEKEINEIIYKMQYLK